MEISACSRVSWRSRCQPALLMQQAAIDAASGSKHGHSSPLARGGHGPRSPVTTGFEQIRDQLRQQHTAICKGAYLEFVGRPGSQADPHLPKESGQGTPERVRTAEVCQRCDRQQVSVMARRARHALAAESDTPLLMPACGNPGLQTPGRDHNREGQALSISSPRRDSHPFPVSPDRRSVNHRHPIGSCPRCQGVDP